MSADNYYLIRKHPNGGFAAVMGFESDDGCRDATERDRAFETVNDAISWACDQNTECGVQVGDVYADEDEILTPAEIAAGYPKGIEPE